MRTSARLSVLVAGVALALVAAACGGGPATESDTDVASSEQAETAQAAETADSATFGIVEWPGVTVKTAVASEILGELGYDTNTKSLSISTVLAGVGEGDLDAFLGVWRPSMTSMVEPHIEDGKLEVANTNLEGTLYKNVVPTYVAENLGVTSMEDLDEHKDAFGGTIYGIEPGNDGNQIIQDAIDNDTYGLGDWTMKPSSTSAMLAQVKQAVANEEPIVFLGWKPHWMNLDYDLTYLEDPENIWGGEGHVETVVTSGLEEDKPNLSTFLSQYEVDIDTQNEWILEYGKKERPADEVAREWISANLDEVKPWLEGVTSQDGTPALQVVEEAFQA